MPEDDESTIFLVLIRTPRHQGVLGPIPEEVTLSTVTGSSVEAVEATITVPLGAEATIVPRWACVVLRGTLTTERVKP